MKSDLYQISSNRHNQVAYNALLWVTAVMVSQPDLISAPSLLLKPTVETDPTVPNLSDTALALSMTSDETVDQENDWSFDEPRCSWKPLG